MKKNILLKLKKDIFYRAKIFIDDMGLFAPFSSEYNNGNVKSVVIYNDEAKIHKGITLIKTLKNISTEKIGNKEIEAVAIAYDVFIDVTEEGNQIKKSNALCLITSFDGIIWDEDYYLYKIVENECVWG